MKILVISDTHGQTGKVLNLLCDIPDITNIIHLGDCVRDAEKIEEVFPDKIYHKAKGNNDYLSFERDFLILNLCGYNIFAAHGHLLGVKKSPDVLAYRAKSFGCNIALFGHTHIFEDKTINGVRCLNPSNKGYFIITDNYIHFDKF